MNNLDLLLAGDRMAWLDREAMTIQRRALALRSATKTAIAAPVSAAGRGTYAGAAAIATAPTVRIDPVGRA